MTNIHFSNEDSLKYLEEDFSSEEVSSLRKQVVQLTSENEQHKQKIYDLRRKLQSDEKVHTEALECQEYAANQITVELKQKIRELTEKFNDEKETLIKQTEELEVELSQKLNEITQLKEVAAKTKFEIVPIVPPQLEVSVTSEKKVQYETEIEKLTMLLQTETERHNRLKEIHASVCNEMGSLHEVLSATKSCSEEKDQVIESLREELVMCQSELNVLKSSSTNASNKGNSIFAELEDSRNKMVEKMKVMHNNYIDMKQALAFKESEIEKIQLEKITLMRMWEEESVKIMAQSKEVENVYKDTVFKLKNKLMRDHDHLEKFINDQLQNPDISFLQSTICDYKKEISKLNSQIENDYIQKCIEQEKIEKLLKEIQYWRYRALSNEKTIKYVESTNKKAELYDLKNSNEKENQQQRKKCKLENAPTVKILSAENDSNIRSTECLMEKTICKQSCQPLSSIKKVKFSIDSEKDNFIDSKNVENNDTNAIHDYTIDLVDRKKENSKHKPRKQKTYTTTVFISSNPK